MMSDVGLIILVQIVNLFKYNFSSRRWIHLEKNINIFSPQKVKKNFFSRIIDRQKVKF